MNELKYIELTYESLIPIKDIKPLTLSVGTVTFSGQHDLNMDFNHTSTQFVQLKNSYVKMHTVLFDLAYEVFWDEYKKLGISPSDFTYDYFLKQKDYVCVSEVYTEFRSHKSKQFLPLTLKGMKLHFTNNRVIDYSDRISVFALAELAEVA